MKKDTHKIIIGRAEAIDFVDQAVLSVPAKTDTGAYRSSVHASKIKENADGTLSFYLLEGHPGTPVTGKKITTSKYTIVTVINSFGHREERFEVKLKVKLGPKIMPVSFSLSNRSKNIYPVLLGRKLLNNRFLVDTSQSGLDRKVLKTDFGIDFPIDEEEGR